MKKITIAITASLLLCTILNFAQGIVINEIISSNTSVNTDEDGTYQDWVELYNVSTSSISLSGYGLTDDAALPFKWTFPEVTMTAGSYLLVWCSDKNRIIPGQPLHTNFKISSAGEPITLTNPGGTTEDAVPAIALTSNISYGRLPNGTGSFFFFQNVTPAMPNSGTAYTEILPQPMFSVQGGFFTDPQTLTLSTSVPGAEIIYTVDGSDPDESNLSGTTYNYRNVYRELPGQTSGAMLSKSFESVQYAAPITIADRSPEPNDISGISSTYSNSPTYIPGNPIFKATVIRARCVKPGALSSPAASQTYFITPAGSSRFPLPVISISISENKLFDYEDGIYVAGKDFDDWRDANPTANAEFEPIGNYFRDGIANERRANFTYFVNGAEVVNQDLGIRIHGGTTRAYELKSLNLYARSDYGPSTISYPFFNDIPDLSFETLTLRNSGGDFRNTMFRDALNQQIVKTLHCETESYQPAVTFINGEFWGIENLREKYDDEYFTRVYGIPKAELDLLEDDGFAEEGDSADYDDMISYLNNNSLATQANYDYIRTRMDEVSFADFYIANIFMDNSDWPGQNIQYWRKKTAFDASAPYGLDGRWRWIFHDMDDTFSIGTDDFNDNALANATEPNGPEYPNPPWSTLILRKLLENQDFKNYFINRFADLMNTNFLSEYVVQTLDAMKSVIYPEIPEHIARWKSPVDLDDYNFYIDYETEFANVRPGLQRNHIRQKFGIASNINAALDVSDIAAGYITMNTIDVKDGTPGISGNPYPWTGIYFSNVPVTLKAVALPGYTFTNWSGASSATTAEITITPAGSFSITANFSPTMIESPEPIYFWVMDGTLPNNLPLTSLSSTFEAAGADAVIAYTSCLPGYPYTSTDPLWRHASMERRNNPTTINYIPEANNNVEYAAADMKGLQIKEPFQSSAAENIMVFNFSTVGYKDIKFSFAAVNELTNVNAILLDYSVTAGTPVWITDGLASSSLGLTDSYQLFNVDFTTISTAVNNPDFKIRLRFSGGDLTVDAGNRVTFNNIAVIGTETQLQTAAFSGTKFIVYPNPFTDALSVTGMQNGKYELFTVDGKEIMSGIIDRDKLQLGIVPRGLYMLRLTSDGKAEIKKIIKR